MSTKTLSQRLAELTSTAPSSTFNPDEPDYDDGTGAGLSKYGHFDGDDDLEGALPSGDGRPSSNFRVAADMESIGREYHGKRVSRKDLVGAFTSFDGEGDVSQQENSDNENSGVEERADGENGDLGAHNAPSTAFSLNLDDVSSSDDQEEPEDDGDKALDDHGSEDEAPEDEQQRHQSNVFAGMRSDVVEGWEEEGTTRLDGADGSKDGKRNVGWRSQGELKRAREALRQRQWWEGLLEVRILLQRLVNAANQLPGPNELPLFLERDESLTALAEEGVGAAQDLAKQLSAVRRSQMACWGVHEDGSDKAPTVAGASSSVGDSAVGEEAVAEREHESCMDWWQSVLGKWHEKTRLVDPSLQKKFRVVNQGPWAQIMAVLADRDRANRKSFMTESETSGFLGRKLAKRLKTAAGDDGEASSLSKAREGEAEEEILGRERRRDEAEDLDLEVVDDRDFYQHLLKEFMEASGAGGIKKGTAAGVPVRRKSRKKSVDRRASKGRKIKYVSHPKMQNFMFPREYGPPPMEPSELFASLFGVAGEAR